MEVSGVIFRPLQGGDTHVRHSCSFVPSLDKIHPRFLSLKPFPKKRSSISSNLSLVSANNASSGFCDNGHVEYYDCPTAATCGVGMKKKEKEKEKEISSKKKTMKKRLKLLKGLSKNLSSFSDMGFGLDPDHGLADQVKGKMISEAADVLLVQLQQLRAEEVELKRKRKEEKAKLRNVRMQKRMGCDNTSSSSSSESSDSECGEVVDMNSLKSGTSLASNGLQPQATVNQEAPTIVLPSTTAEVIALPSTEDIQARLPAVAPYSSENSSCNSRNITILESIAVGSNNTNGPVVVEASAKKIEVCMGGKCKKSGAGLLLDEFQKAVGGEGAVVGCKCMGKCRDGPNVRVKNPETEMVSNNPLCLGVGLEDVSLIVSNFFGGNQHSDTRLAHPAAAS